MKVQDKARKTKIATLQDYRNRHKIIPAVFLLLIRNKKILMLRRFQTGYRDGEYSLISGHLEKEESITAAMVREAQEEAGITIKAEDLELIHVMNRKDESGERIDFYFTVSQFKGEPKNMEQDKCDDMQWFDLDKLPEFTIEFVEDAILNFKNEIFYSEVGY